MAVAWDIRRFDELDSTNRWVLDQARAGAAEGLVAVAGFQTAGRGRLGRTWTAPPGASLLTSILLRPSLPADRLHLATAAVALSAADASAVVAGLRPDLKWPNDLLVDGRKLAGILAEVDRDAVVVGIGVNLNWPPDVPPELAETMTSANFVAGRPVDLERFLAEMLDALAPRLHRWDEVAAEYRSACATVGRVVRVELVGEAFIGEATDVTPEGHLVVRDDGGLARIVTAGDVGHLR